MSNNFFFRPISAAASKIKVVKVAKRPAAATPRRASSSSKKSTGLRPWKVRGNSRRQTFPYFRHNGKLNVSWQRMTGLNIHRNYGKSRSSSRTWGAASGIRELVQNLYDAILDVRGIFPHEVRVEELRKGEEVAADAPSLDLSTNPLELFLYDMSRPSAWGMDTKPVGYIAWKPSSEHAGFGDLELYNVGRMPDTAWCLGGSSKGSNPHLIGQYGDGLKMGINALLREDASVLYHTENDVWVFGYLEDRLFYHEKKSTRCVDGVIVQVRNIPLHSLALDRFLFLRPPTSILTYSQVTGWTRGCVLLDDKHRSHIYVKGILVREEKDKTTGLVYGINIAEDISMSRDRSALEDRTDAAEAIFRIWQPLLLTSDDARTRYLDLLQNNERVLDVEGVEDLNPACAKALLSTLQKQHSDTAFFFYSRETTDARRIIEDYLHKKPVLLTESLYDALRVHKTILTPAEAQEKAFRSLPPVEPDEQASIYVRHVLHSIRALLHLDVQTARFLKSLAFKSGHFDVLEISVTGDQVHLTENLLKLDYVHKKPGYSACPYAEPTEEDDLTTKSICCDCASTFISTSLVDDSGVSQQSREQLKSRQRHLIGQTPRNLSYTIDAPGSVSVSWSTAVSIPASRGFVVSVMEVKLDALLSTELVYTAEPSGKEPATEVDARQYRTTPEPTIVLSDLKPGTRYALQARAGSKKEAIWSTPQTFAIPPLSVTGVCCQWPSPGSIRLQWDAAPGAAKYSLILLAADQGIIDHHEDISDCHWEGQADEKRVESIRISSCSSEGISNLQPFEALVEHIPAHPQPKAVESPKKTIPPEPTPAVSTEVPTSPKPKKSPSPSRRSPSESSADPPPKQQPASSPNIAKPAKSPSPHCVDLDSDSDNEMAFEPLNFTRDDDSDSDVELVDTNEDYETGADVSTDLQGILSTLFDRPESPPPVASHASSPKKSGRSSGTAPVSRKPAEQIRSGCSYQFNMGDIRFAISIHKVTSGNPKHIFGTRFIFASDYFKDVYLDPLTLSDLPDHELIRLVEPDVNPDHIEQAEFDYDVVYRWLKGSKFKEIKIRQGEDAPPGVHHWSLSMSGDAKGKTLTIFNKDNSFTLDPSRVSAASVVDLYAGCGGVSRGFDAAGFNVVAAVEERMDAAISWQFNFPDAPMHAENLQVFLDDLEARKIAPPDRVTVLTISVPSNISSHHSKLMHFTAMVKQAITQIQPAFLCIFGWPEFLGCHGGYGFHGMELSLLSGGYSVSYKLLDIAEYGVAATSERLVLIASAAGLRLPDWPQESHSSQREGTAFKQFQTVRDAIQDLEWRNPRQPADAFDMRRGVYCTVPDGHQVQQPSDYAVALGAMQDKVVGHHITGPAEFAEKRPIADYEQPYPLPAGTPQFWPRRHPKHVDEYISPRELARIVSFPVRYPIEKHSNLALTVRLLQDLHRFNGHRYEQYVQITTAVPPLLSKAIAMSIQRSLLQQFPEHTLQSNRVAPDTSSDPPSGAPKAGGKLNGSPVRPGSTGQKRHIPDETTESGPSFEHSSKRMKLEQDEVEDIKETIDPQQ
ncbi:hypothetical protein DENSPDRAFT_326921 [Dentipellis sp. KUC8613]|nr:hypothetical protein DENSPDRAFT_326921 [Dentipellis sp. KUC8613]